jgi:hypothetical protein
MCGLARFSFTLVLGLSSPFKEKIMIYTQFNSPVEIVRVIDHKTGHVEVKYLDRAGRRVVKFSELHADGGWREVVQAVTHALRFGDDVGDE